MTIKEQQLKPPAGGAAPLPALLTSLKPAFTELWTLVLLLRYLKLNSLCKFTGWEMMLHGLPTLSKWTFLL